MHARKRRLALSWLLAGSLAAAPAAAQQTIPDLIPGGVFQSVAPSLSNSQKYPLQLDSSGNLKVNVAAGGASGGTSSTFGAPFPGTGTAAGFSLAGNMAYALVDASHYLDVDVQASVLPTGAATSALQTAINATLGALFPAGGALGAGSAIIGKVGIDQTTPGTTNGVQVNAALPAGTNSIGQVTANVASEYPSGATAETISATGTTGATTATLAAAGGKTTYICGFSIRANATAAATGNATVTGTITGTLNFTQWTAPNANGLGIAEMIFHPCVPASGTNTTIAIISAAPGTGGVVSVTGWGYQL